MVCLHVSSSVLLQSFKPRGGTVKSVVVRNMTMSSLQLYLLKFCCLCATNCEHKEKVSQLIICAVHSTHPHPGTSVSEGACTSESPVTRNVAYPCIQTILKIYH